ncbi:MAG TPA: glutamine amidotransferase [Stellaceae bacterium]|nr:glutamine amidotransferase [Stellaceae bacterium]
MPSLVAIRHVAFEDLDGFAAPLAARGYAITYRDAPVDDLAAPELAAADLVVVLGGPIGAYEEALYPFLNAELRLIEARLAAGRPVLGICLGAQLMARALGARVYPGQKELGWAPLELTEAGRASPLRFIAPEMKVLHWHGDTFDMPAGASHLAATERNPHQAFAYQRHALGLQFHIEATAPGLERWYVGHAVEIAATRGTSVAMLRADAARHAPILAPRGKAVLESWLDQFQERGGQ